MITVSNLGITFQTKKLFEGVNLKFLPGNCYGIIGANGAGKSTFLNILSKKLDSTTGDVIFDKGIRLSVLEQDHFKFDEFSVTETVLMGHTTLYDVMSKRDALYAKEDFTEEDGYASAELEEQFANMNGYEAESDAQKLLSGLNLKAKDYNMKMNELHAGDKVKVLLARALFGNPDCLILDEPTNHLDFYAVKWLEEFLINFEKTVLVVSHDRHFLNNVCTHIVDIDFGDAKLFIGNYDFWRQSSELLSSMMKDQNKKKEERIKELEDFIARFSANASKSKQATSRKKTLDKIELDHIKPSSRRYPFIHLPIARDIGRDVVSVRNLNVTIEGQKILNNISFDVNGEDKVLFMSNNDIVISTLFRALNKEIECDSGEISFGETAQLDYLPLDNADYFDGKKSNLVDWLREYSGEEQSESYIRSFLGKMLFSGEEPLKNVSKLSGGEKVRMMFSKLMLSKANTLILDQPTNHLDLESIQSVNEALEKFEGSLMFSSHDLSFVESIATKVICLTPVGAVEFLGNFNEFSDNEELRKKIEDMYEE